MSKLSQHIEEMRARLNRIAGDEQALIKALGEALDRLDEALLRDVRAVKTEHNARREAILGELQSLAAGIGMFRGPLQVATEELPAYTPLKERTQAIAPGDWRRATSNIEDELDYGPQLNGHAPSP